MALIFTVLLVGLLEISSCNASPQNVIRMNVNLENERDFIKSPSSHSSKDAAAFAFAKHFQDEMVLQRAPQRANIYGFSPNIGGKLVMTVTDSDSLKSDRYETIITQGSKPGVGVWLFTLNPMATGTTVSVQVQDESKDLVLKLSDVIFGDVWVCSGQSNMEFTVNMMTRAKEELEDAHNYPNIRIFAAALNSSSTPIDDLLGIMEAWSKPSNASLGGKPWGKPWNFFSAVCWLYGKYIHKALGIPIGLVDTNWGGTPVEAWSSPDALAKCNLTSKVVNGPQTNSVLWNAMVHPLLGMTIYGAIWYQGEQDQNHPQVDRYACTFPAMIDDWRAKFHLTSKGETNDVFPFGFVQLSANSPDPSISFGFPNIRWHQTADYGYVPNPRMPKVFMAVAMDLPGFSSKFGSIHPPDKTDVGYRLSLSGLHVAYDKDLVSQGPFPDKIIMSGDRINITYGNVPKVEVRDWSGFELLCAASSSSDQVWLPTSLISNYANTVSVYLNVCLKDQKVAGIRYAWRESPCGFKQCAVYETVNGLPGPQFIAYLTKSSDGMETFKFDGPTQL
ncbi:sialate O-acetylesterase [Elysia marginata]|uniref:Sialate O-acetylesterase n=1 Tax=Elysia marginata TaxID=1093978 RepID=A0AAV4HN53_9GAST|nr:sialate O-acetylesterase [Elysia marginata]